MTITADRCVLVESPWVHAFILTCDGKLAVWFKRRVRGGRRVPGVCCYYPNTNRNFFNLAISWGRPGKFVHRFLYRRLAYQVIKPPCPAVGCVATACCANNLPATLHASNADFGSVALTWDGSAYWASGVFTYGGQDTKLRFSCPAGSTDCTGLELEIACAGSGLNVFSSLSQAAGCTCSPLSATYNLGPTPACGVASESITVTT
jgi:hypothetical protein